jgi:hypothetical protein
MGSHDGGQAHPEQRDDVPAEEIRDEETPDEATEAERAYVAGLLARGEAAEPDENGELPPGATHEVVRDEAGRMTVRRRRFSAF